MNTGICSTGYDYSGHDYSGYTSSVAAFPAIRGGSSSALPGFLRTVTVGKPKGALKTMKDDIKNFIIENRTIIYWLMILLIVDQWIFQGRFREKLHELFESLIDRIKTLFEAHEPHHLVTKPPQA